MLGFSDVISQFQHWSLGVFRRDITSSALESVRVFRRDITSSALESVRVFRRDITSLALKWEGFQT